MVDNIVDSKVQVNPNEVGRRSLISLIKSDISVNRRNPKGLLLAILYRTAHSCLFLPSYAMPLGYIWILFYKLVTEYILGTEIHWRSQIGPCLTIYHGYGLVVNSSARIGSGCILRHAVTIGVKATNGEHAAPIIGNNVDIGVGAIILGGITVGNDCIIDAGSIVTKSLPDGVIAAGNPARVIKLRDTGAPPSESEAQIRS